MQETVRYLRQLRAFTWSTFLTQVRNPSAIMFGFVFPIIFMLFFGYINTSQNTDLTIGILEDNTRAYSEFADLIEDNPVYTFESRIDQNDLEQMLISGDLDAYIRIENIEIEEEKWHIS